MNISSMQLYVQMQDDIRQLQQFSKTEILLIEDSFNIARRYWFDIESRLESYSFKHKADEMYFYRNIKPLFTSVMEYYCLRYKAVLFKPARGRTQLSLYWINELQRIDHFYKRHCEFYRYWVGGCTDNDEIYFSRPPEAANKLSKRSTRKRTNSFYDDIAARILGYQEYRRYIELEMISLLHDNDNKIIEPHKNVFTNTCSPG